MLLLAAASNAGLPPLPGFIGKLMLLQAASHHPWAVAVWAVVLVVGFFTLVGLARAGSILFWSVRPDMPGGNSGSSRRLLLAMISLLAMSVLLSIYAAPIQRYTAAAALQMMDRDAYARAVLSEQGGAQADTVRPYRIPQVVPFSGGVK
jgi:multicomponent K+:H+ antiporter subunit D